jgi:hypothetical protein
VKFLSFVKRGANKMPVLYKDQGDLTEFRTMMKSAEEGELLTVTFAPEYRDADLTIASLDVVKQMAYSHAESGFELDLFHDGESLKPEQAFIAESFIIQKGDPRFADWKDTDGKPVDVTGGWGNVIKINSPELRAAVKDGTVSGVSVYGPAIVALNKSDELADHLSLRLRGEPKLDPKELVATLLKALDERDAKIIAALKPSAPVADSKVAELELSLKKSADESAATIATLTKSVETLTAEKTAVETKLAEALKTSNAPVNTAALVLNKTIDDARAKGAEIAKRMAASRGVK